MTSRKKWKKVGVLFITLISIEYLQKNNSVFEQVPLRHYKPFNVAAITVLHNRKNLTYIV